MVVKQDRFEFGTALEQVEFALLRSVDAPGPTSTDEQIDALLKNISQGTAELNGQMITLVRLLAERGAWCATVRLLVGVGGYRSAEIAEALGVMRSTVTRWYNGETTPQQAQTAVYFKRLLSYMQETRPFDLQADLGRLIQS